MTHEPMPAYQWVVTAEAERWIAQVMRDHATSPAMIERLRQELTGDQIDEVILQARLRTRGRKKFSLADRMFFTDKALQQATDERTAKYKASGFPNGPIADLCCGIGGDLLALSLASEVTAVDQDPRCTIFATANCRVHERPAVDVQNRDVKQIDLKRFAAWHIDPDRRSNRGRTTLTEFSQPTAEEIDDLLAQNINAGIKLAAASDIPTRWESAAELEWIGIDRECRQLYARFGELATHPSSHVATILNSDGSLAAQIVGSPKAVPIAAQVGCTICEPHATVIAARLVGTLANHVGLMAVAPEIAYLTGDSTLHSPAMTRFDVEDVMPFDLRRIRAALRFRQWGHLEIKRRGLPDREALTPEKLRKRLRVPGDQSGVLFLMPKGPQVIAVLARRQGTPL